jgi:RND family efflux transporter MFP subunit
LIGEAASILYIALIALLAQATGLFYILFPELGALSHDILKRPHGAWAQAPLMLVLTPFLTAVVGTVATQHLSYSPISVFATIGAAILIVWLLRSPIAPAISAGLLPLVLGVSSWWYPPSILVGTGSLAGIAMAWARLNPPLSAAPSTSQIVDDIVEETPADYSWIPFFLTFLFVVITLAWLTGWRFMLFPPLVVIAFEMFAHASVCSWAGRPLILPLACALSAAIGVLAVGLLGPGPLAAACSMAFAGVALRIFDLHAPPALAVGLLPFVIAQPTYQLPISVGAGTLVLTITFLAWQALAQNRLLETDTKNSGSEDQKLVTASFSLLKHLHQSLYEVTAERLGKEERTANAAKALATRGRATTAFEEVTEAGSMKKHRWRVSAAMFIVLVIGGDVAYWRTQNYKDLVDGRTPIKSPLTYMTGRAAIDAVTAASVIPKVSGAIQGIYCEVGFRVKKGQVCATLDPRPYRLAVDQAKASLAQAYAKLGKAKPLLIRARAALDRLKNLAKRRPVGQKTLKAARKAFEQRQEQIVRNEKSAVTAATILRSAEINLASVDLVSPIAGTVIAKNAEAGKNVDATTAEPLFLVTADPNFVKITVSADKGVAEAMKLGEPVSFTADVAPGHMFGGEVTQISLAPHSREGAEKYDVVLTVSNPDFLLKPGSSMQIRSMLGKPPS